MELSPQITSLLLSVAGELDKAARQCKVAGIWLKTHHCPGLAHKAYVEAKERWAYSDMIYNRIIERGGMIQAIPAVPAAPASGTGWTAESVFNGILQADKNVTALIQKYLTHFAQSQDHANIKFLLDIQDLFWKDINEVKEIIDQSGKAVPPALVILDNKYLDQYEE